jgi:hypothetical protein
MILFPDWVNYKWWFKLYLSCFGLLAVYLFYAFTLSNNDPQVIGIGVFSALIYIVLFAFVFPRRLVTQKLKFSQEELDEKALIFRGIIQRSPNTNLSELTKILEMNQDMLLKWLYKLPPEFGFTIDKGIIEFDKENLDTHIDQLIDEFKKMEQESIGKV